MRPSYQTPSTPSLVSPSPREIKVISQRQYRANEGECFDALRRVIHELTGDELPTRQEILKKATDLLLAVSEMKKAEKVKVKDACLTSREMYSLTENIPQVHMGYAGGPSFWLPHRNSMLQSNMQSTYNFSQLSSHGQQNYFTYNMDSVLNQFSGEWQEAGSDPLL